MVGPIGCKIFIHTTSNNRKSWDQRGRKGFSVVPALHHYHFIQAIDSKTKSMLFTYTEEYLHDYLTQPRVTSEDRMTHDIHFLSVAIKDVPTSLCNSQITDIKAVCEIFSKWITVESYPTVPSTALSNPPKPIVPLPKPSPIRYPAPTSKGDHGQ